MIESALLYFLISVGVFLGLILLTSTECRRGRRLFASHVRETLDARIERWYLRLAKLMAHFLRYIVQLHWYYSIHSVLKTALRVVVALYTRLESSFERNRTRAKELRAEKRQQKELSHLEQVSAHKEETALTPAQQRKLREKKLEERY